MPQCVLPFWLQQNQQSQNVEVHWVDPKVTHWMRTEWDTDGLWVVFNIYIITVFIMLCIMLCKPPFFFSTYVVGAIWKRLWLSGTSEEMWGAPMFYTSNLCQSFLWEAYIVGECFIYITTFPQYSTPNKRKEMSFHVFWTIRALVTPLNILCTPFLYSSTTEYSYKFPKATQGSKQNKKDIDTITQFVNTQD